jgi:hypothetical protein
MRSRRADRRRALVRSSVLQSLVLSLAVVAGAAPPGGGGESAVQADGVADPPLRVADLGWLAGAWRGTLGGDAIEEHWTAPDDGEMVGVFRWARRPPIYELLLLEDDPQGAVMRLRHFGPRLVAWEEQDAALVFRASGHGRCWALFREEGDDEEGSRLRYRREAGGDLVIELIERRDGGDSSLVFRYRPLAAPVDTAECGGPGG